MTIAVARATASQARPIGRGAIVLAGAGTLLILAILGSLAIGPVVISPADVLRILVDGATGTRPTTGTAMRDAIVVLDIRLPRTVLAVLV
jgi:iron complex transport system permease protein